MFPQRLSVLLAAACCATSAAAGPFLAATATATSSEYEDVNNGYGYVASVGYQLDNFPLFLEAEYYDSGDLDIDDGFGMVGGRLQYQGGLVYLGASGKLSGNSRVWLKAGYYQFDGKLHADSVNGVPLSTTEEINGYSLGVGIDWLLNRSFGLRAEIETPMDVKSIPGLPGDESGQLSVIRLGFVWRPDFSSPTYEAPPPPVGAVLPATAAGTQVADTYAPGQKLLARPGSLLRANPDSNSPTVQVLSPSPLLTLEASLVNATGQWWFVQSDIERGWLRAEELIKP